jgi:hypothetical protein
LAIFNERLDWNIQRMGMGMGHGMGMGMGMGKGMGTSMSMGYVNYRLVVTA